MVGIRILGKVMMVSISGLATGGQLVGNDRLQGDWQFKFTHFGLQRWNNCVCNDAIPV